MVRFRFCFIESTYFSNDSAYATANKFIVACYKRLDSLWLQETESEDDILDEGDDDVEDEHDHEPEVPVHPEPVVKKTPEVSEPPKETERQLSKKEKKKKELAELEALLADFGVTQNESNGQDESRGKCAPLSVIETPSNAI